MGVRFEDNKMIEKICLNHIASKRKVVLTTEQMKCYDCGGFDYNCKDYEPVSKICDRAERGEINIQDGNGRSIRRHT